MIDQKEQSSGIIDGISLASFLQILEHERKSCTLVVTCGAETGSLYLSEGELVDASCGDRTDLDAAHFVLSWEESQFSVEKEEDRLQRINQPMARILINAATANDEAQEYSSTGDRNVQQDWVSAHLQGNPVLVDLVDRLIAIPGVKHYYLLNQQGKMITQSSRNQKIADFIAYSVVSGIQMRKTLAAKGLYRVMIMLNNGDKLMITPGGGMIVGLMLDESASLTEVSSWLRKAVTR